MCCVLLFLQGAQRDFHGTFLFCTLVRESDMPKIIVAGLGAVGLGETPKRCTGSAPAMLCSV